MRRLLFVLLAFTCLSVPASADDEERKPVLCAYFLPTGNHRVKYCTHGPLEEAQKRCDEKLRKQKIEGTCDCTDDASFIGDRCK